jgi:hypothetical protein
MSGTPAPFTRIGMHAGNGSLAYCFTYADTAPILDISTGNASISLSIAGRDIDDAALSFARELLQNVQVFTAEVERLHTERAAPTGHVEHVEHVEHAA